MFDSRFVLWFRIEPLWFGESLYDSVKVSGPLFLTF